MENINIELIEKDIEKLIEEIEGKYIDQVFDVRESLHVGLTDILCDVSLTDLFDLAEQGYKDVEFDMDKYTGYFRLLSENSHATVYVEMFDEDGEEVGPDYTNADVFKIIAFDFQYDLTYLNEDEEEEQQI